MGALLGLVLGLGVLLIWRSGPRAPQLATAGRRGGPRAVRELLRQAGVDGVGPAQLLGGSGRVCALVAFGARPGAHSTVDRRRRASRVFAFFAAGGGGAPHAPASAGRAARAVARGGRQPRLGRARRHVAARGPGRAGSARPGRAARDRSRGSARPTGRPDGSRDCLDALKDELADPVGDRVCETVRVAREVGGSDLGTVLRTLSELLRADARTRAELETRQGWVVNAARLAVAAPWVVLLLLGTQSHDAARVRLRRAARCCSAIGAARVRGGLPDHAAHRPAARGTAGAAVSRWLLGAGARPGRPRSA